MKKDFAIAVALALALLLLLGLVTGALANHALAPGAQIAWQRELDRVDEALGHGDVRQAVLLWREAFAAALRSRHWEGLVAVGDAYRRLGERGGFQNAAAAKARQTYLAALFRARQDGSVDGVLRVAEAFAALGDREVVLQCIKISRAIAATARDERAAGRVRSFAERWAARGLGAEKVDGLRMEDER